MQNTELGRRLSARAHELVICDQRRGCAVEGLAKALALEIAPTRVNVVAPGIIDTEAFDRLGEGRSTALENMGKNIPIGRVGRAEEVGLAILHAMENPYMTGATIDIDGGILLP